MKPITLLAFCGSLRQKSHNRSLLEAVKTLLPEGMSLEIYDIKDIPLYNADTEAIGTPPPVLDFKAKIQAADGIIIATPEYNYSIPGGLKNALDWISRVPNPISGKQVVIMGASSGYFGTARAQLALRNILFRLNAFVLPQPEVYVTMAAEKFNENGELTDEETKKRLKELLDTFCQWVNRS
jgi:chromate reductase, NAD(P)H dehydrogenase (quinone)